jgi:hypothetical protein
LKPLVLRRPGEFAGTFGARMAAVFTFSVTTAALRSAVIPRWIAGAGDAAVLGLLFAPPISRRSQLLFPGWVLLISVVILVTSGEL